MRRLYAPRGPLSRVPRSGPVARVLAEHQRLDRDRHGLRGHADAPEIDVVEVPQDYAVDDEDLALDADLVPQDRAQGLSDVTVDHNVYRRALREGVPCQRNASAASVSPSTRSKAVKWARMARASASGSMRSPQAWSGCSTCRLRRGKSAPGSEM